VVRGLIADGVPIGSSTIPPEDSGEHRLTTGLAPQAAARRRKCRRPKCSAMARHCGAKAPARERRWTSSTTLTRWAERYMQPHWNAFSGAAGHCALPWDEGAMPRVLTRLIEDMLWMRQRSQRGAE